MPVFVSTDLPGPENFHEVTRLRPVEIIEVLSKLQLMKKAGRAGSICIPAAPDAFAIALIANDQSFQCGIIEMQLTTRAQSLDRPDEYQIRCARAETRRGLRRENEKFAGLEVCRRLKTDLCEMRNRITAALRHLFDLLKDQTVVITRERHVRRGSKNHKKNPSRQSLHGGISNHQKPIWQWRRPS